MVRGSTIPIRGRAHPGLHFLKVLLRHFHVDPPHLWTDLGGLPHVRQRHHGGNKGKILQSQAPSTLTGP